MAINTTALDGDESMKEVDALSSSQTGMGMLFGWQFFLPRHVKQSGFLKASFSCLTAMSVAFSLALAMDPCLFQHCRVLLQSQKDIFVATPNWQRSWCFVQLPCSLWEIELDYCKSISTVKLCISTHLLVTALRQCSKWTFIIWRTDIVIHHYQQREQTVWILV